MTTTTIRREDTRQRSDQGYGWLSYVAAVAVCASGAGKSRNVNDLKSVEEVQYQLSWFGGKDNTHTRLSREEVVQALEELVTQGTLIKLGERYRRADRTCCRFIAIDGGTEMVAIVEFFEDSTGIDYRFMLPPNLCERYNGVVSDALRHELTLKFSQGLLTVRQIIAASAAGKMTLWTQNPAGLSGKFAQGGAN